jgi:hypothetical protein
MLISDGSRLANAPPGFSSLVKVLARSVNDPSNATVDEQHPAWRNAATMPQVVRRRSLVGE